MPSPDARRRNQPTIAQQALPAGGREGPAPECPLELMEHGARWWAWAWGTPQAAMWDAGALYFVARRARLEDDLHAHRFSEEVDLGDLLAGADREAVRRVEFALGTLARLASGEGSVIREMRELENRLGLNPKAMLDLRWRVAEEEPVAEGAPAGGVGGAGGRRRGLRIVDPKAVGE